MTETCFDLTMDDILGFITLYWAFFLWGWRHQALFLLVS